MKQDKLVNLIKRILKAVLCFGIFYFSGYFQYIPIFLFKITKITPHTYTALSLFSNLMAAILIGILYFKDLKNELKRFISHWKEDLDIGLKYWVLGLFIMMVSNMIINVFSTEHIAGNEKAVQSMIESLPWMMLINAGFIAPFVEEITFRKTFKTIIENKWAYALISGIIFGGMHVIGNIHSFVDVLYIIPYSALGITFALAYSETDTVFTSMSFHIIHNTLLTLLSIMR